MARHPTLLVLALVTLAPLRAAAQSEADVLEHIRPGHRDALPAELEVASIEALPRYDLHLSVAEDLHGFGLRETLDVTNAFSTPLPELVLRIFVNATPPEGMGPQVTLVAGRCLGEGDVEVNCTIEQRSPTVIDVTPAQPLAPGERLRVQLDLHGRLEAIDPSRTGMLAQGLEGMSAFESGGGGHGYGLLAHDGRIATLAAFFPVLARRDASGWVTDDHGTTGDLGTDAMANVTARVVVPRDFTVAATGETTRRRPVRDGDGEPRRDEVTVSAGAIRDFALVVSGEMTTLDRAVGDVTVRSIFRSDHQENGARVLEVAAAALEIFERRFGPYPYTALDVVEAPLVGGAGGVEFSSMVTVASMFYEGMGGMEGLSEMLGGISSDLGSMNGMSEAMIEFVTAHEVAHQWWHGIVGSDSRAHPVTDESLAQWSAVLYMEERYGAERAAQEAERQVALNYVMMRVNDFADAPADQPASAYDPPVTYAGIVYGKAPFLWIRLRERLGDAAFFAGVQAYVARYRMRIAPPDGLIEILASAADRRRAAEIRRLGRRWLSERHGDDDMGPITEDRMLTAMLGEGAADPSSPTRMLMRFAMSALRGGGADGHGLGAPDLGGMLGGEGGDVDLDALRGMMGDMDPEAMGEMLEAMEALGEDGDFEEVPSRRGSRGPTRITP